MKSLQAYYQCTAKTVLILFLWITTSTVFACDKAQMVDYDYHIKNSLNYGDSTFGRLWLLDNQESCIDYIKYRTCLSIEPSKEAANLTIKINIKEGVSSIYKQEIKYNSSEVIRFNLNSMNVYFKLFVSNTIADLKMSGRSCKNGFPSLPRQVTRKERDNMFR